MIIFVSTSYHRKTHRTIEKSIKPFRRMGYPHLLMRRSLPRATYIFTDFDRLSFWQLELAANVYRQLQAAGCPVLNNPARALHRLPLLRRLHREGINSFNAWPAEERVDVTGFPVFVRTRSAHRGNLTDLLQDMVALEKAVEELVCQGYPLADLMICEYRAEPLHNDVYRKMSMYRIGNRMIGTPSVHECHWTVKEGEAGVANAESYAEDLERVKTRPHARAVRKAFECAKIDYGRADYGLVAGRLEFYEINSNPNMGFSQTHAFEDRNTALQLTEQEYQKAMLALDSTKAGPAINITPSTTFKSRSLLRSLFPGYQWTP